MSRRFLLIFSLSLVGLAIAAVMLALLIEEAYWPLTLSGCSLLLIGAGLLIYYWLTRPVQAQVVHEPERVGGRARVAVHRVERAEENSFLNEP